MPQDAGGTLPITTRGAGENKRGKQRSCYSPFSSACLDQLPPEKYDTQSYRAHRKTMPQKQGPIINTEKYKQVVEIESPDLLFPCPTRCSR